MSSAVEEAEAVASEADSFTRDTLSIEGQLKSGEGFYNVRVNLALRGNDLTDPTFAASLPALLQNLGVEPIIQKAPAATAATAAAPTGQPATSGEGCPVHGTQYVKPGFRGQGFECKADARTAQSWSKDKPWTDRDGVDHYYCKSKWS